MVILHIGEGSKFCLYSLYIDQMPKNRSLFQETLNTIIKVKPINFFGYGDGVKILPKIYHLFPHQKLCDDCEKQETGDFL